jgi:hypothetical protein
VVYLQYLLLHSALLLPPRPFSARRVTRESQPDPRERDRVGKLYTEINTGRGSGTKSPHHLMLLACIPYRIADAQLSNRERVDARLTPVGSSHMHMCGLVYDTLGGIPPQRLSTSTPLQYASSSPWGFLATYDPRLRRLAPKCGPLQEINCIAPRQPFQNPHVLSCKTKRKRLDATQSAYP